MIKVNRTWFGLIAVIFVSILFATLILAWAFANKTQVSPYVFQPADIIGEWKHSMSKSGVVVSLKISADGMFRETIGEINQTGRWSIVGSLLKLDSILEFDGAHYSPRSSYFLLVRDSSGVGLLGGVYLDPDNYERFEMSGNETAK